MYKKKFQESYALEQKYTLAFQNEWKIVTWHVFLNTFLEMIDRGYTESDKGHYDNRKQS